MANEETGFGTVKCPGCGEAIPISEAIHHQIAERTRQEFKASGMAAQLYSFLHNLSEESRGRDNMVLAVSIPASDNVVAVDSEGNRGSLCVAFIPLTSQMKLLDARGLSLVPPAVVGLAEDVVQ